MMLNNRNVLTQTGESAVVSETPLLGRKITHATLIGSYAPRQCGIATFSQDLRNAQLMDRSALRVGVAMMCKEPSCSPAAAEVVHLVDEQTRVEYGALRNKLNASDTEVVSLQHEYGIFGGPDGAWILDTLRGLRVPVVTTCHTVLANPSVGQHQVLMEVARLSSKLVVMTEKARDLLNEIYRVPLTKIALIPHGIPDFDPAQIDRKAVRSNHGWTGRKVLLTTGLLSPNKGIQDVISALPSIVAQHPTALYVVAGASHPDLVSREGEAYRKELEEQAERLGLSGHVQFINQFATRQDLVSMITAADVFVTPYLNEAQITSGVLAYASGLGKPVISTPYWHAVELLTSERGVLVPFASPSAIAEAANTLFSDTDYAAALAAAARAYGRCVTWRNTGKHYLAVFDEAVAMVPARRHSEHVGLEQLHRMTGPLGIYQHAVNFEPDLPHGYCTDDNARALIAALDLERSGHPDSWLNNLKHVSFQFLCDAFDESEGRFCNFRDTAGRWLDSPGSEDSHGRAMWALGHTAQHATGLAMRLEAARLFHLALPSVLLFTSPRAWAFTLLGLAALRRSAVDQRYAIECQSELASRIMILHAKTSNEDWCWFESELSYDNARLPQALLVTGGQTGHMGMLSMGLNTLRWLMKMQQSPEGYFRAIGSDGFCKRTDLKPAHWDQQPLEAYASLAACIEAHRHGSAIAWEQQAQSAFAWFAGGNDHGYPIGNFATGVCFDGLQEHGLNKNCGAESTLAFLQSCAEIRLHHSPPPQRSHIAAVTHDTSEVNSEAMQSLL